MSSGIDKPCPIQTGIPWGCWEVKLIGRHCRSCLHPNILGAHWAFEMPAPLQLPGFPALLLLPLPHILRSPGYCQRCGESFSPSMFIGDVQLSCYLLPSTYHNLELLLIYLVTRYVSLPTRIKILRAMRVYCTSVCSRVSDKFEGFSKYWLNTWNIK